MAELRDQETGYLVLIDGEPVGLASKDFRFTNDPRVCGGSRPVSIKELRDIAYTLEEREFLTVAQTS